MLMLANDTNKRNKLIHPELSYAIQLQRYLQSINKKLGLLVNFRYRYLKPLRIVKIETDTRSKFV